MLKQEQFTTLERKIERFARLLDQNPGDGLTVLALAEASFRRGLKLEALTAYQVVTERQPVPEAHLAVAEIYSQQNMTTEAYGELRQLFKLDPTNVEARLLAQLLQKQAPAPSDIDEILNEPASEEAFTEARLRLKIQRTIHNRELQERTRNVTLEPGVVIHEYYVEEAKKKLIEVDEQLRKLEELKLFNATLSVIPTPVPVQPEEVVSAAEEETAALEAPDLSQAESLVETSSVEDPAPVEVLDIQSGTPELPVELSDPTLDIEMSGQESTEMGLAEPGSEGEETILSTDATIPVLEAPPAEVEPDLPLAEENEAAESVDSSSEPLAVEPFSSTSDQTSELTLEQPTQDLGEIAPPDLTSTLLTAEPEQPTEEEAPSFDPAGISELPPVPEPPPLPTDLGVSPPAIEIAQDQLDDSEVEGTTTPDLPAEVPVPAESTEMPPEASNSFDLDFSIGVDNPLAPDLPSEDDLQAETASAPLPVGDESLMTSQSPPEVADVPTDFTSIPTIVEPISTPVSEPEAQAEEAVAEPVAEEVSPPVAEPEVEVSMAVSAAERQAFYESKAEELGKLTGTLARTRGVTSIFLVSRDGMTIDSVVKDNITEERVGELVKESFEFLLAYANSPSYWVLECTGGIFVMQTLDPDHVLIAIGQAGANFGALRYTMDKTKTKFGAILKDVPK